MNSSILKNRFPLWLALVCIIATAAIVYGKICTFPFVFDDLKQITYNAKIRDLGRYGSFEQLIKPRRIVDLTFALNYRLDGLNARGYHIFNILIHIINGIIVYFLALIVFGRFPKFPKTLHASVAQSAYFGINIMALFAALIFIAHPVQTQAVTYTTQRYTSMASMFYLASVLFYLRARPVLQHAKQTRHVPPVPLCGACIMCGVLAFLSKQNTASLPAAIALSEYMIVDRSWQGWKKKLPWFALAFALWALFIFYVFGFFSQDVQSRGLLEEVSRVTHETKTVSRWNYLCTQFNVITIYIRLLFLPIHQNIDYQYPFKTGFFDGYTPLAFLFLVGILGLAIGNSKKRPPIAFGILWFFITLSVESSLIPISDAMFEHRLYLPLFGFAVVVPYSLFHFLSPRKLWPVIISIITIAFLGTATYLRNIAWENGIALWKDVISKNPQNARAHNNLGLTLTAQGRTAEAIKHYSQALSIDPEHVEALNNLGLALVAQGRIAEALQHYSKAISISPGDADTYVNLGNALAAQGRLDEAISRYTTALQIDPQHADAHNNLGNALSAQGRLHEALDQYTKAIRLSPDRAQFHMNKALALTRQGRTAEAIKQYSQALRIFPDYAGAHVNLGIALATEGRIAEAIRHYSAALRIDPGFGIAHYNLGTALASQGKLKEAIPHYSAALRIDPNHAEAHNNLGTALIRTGRIEAAISHFKAALRIRPDYAHAKKNLAAAMKQIGH